jgi:hypothetical protein
VHDPLFVSRDEDGRNLLCYLQFLGLFETLSLGNPKAPPFYEFKDKEITVIPFDIIIDLADIRVLELRQDARFSEKPGLGLKVQAGFFTDRLDSDLSFEGLVEALVDIPHAPPAEDVDDADVSDRFSKQTH